MRRRIVGTVTRWRHPWGFIYSEDGTEYFLHQNGLVDRSHVVHLGDVMMFTARNVSGQTRQTAAFVRVLMPVQPEHSRFFGGVVEFDDRQGRLVSGQQSFTFDFADLRSSVEVGDAVVFEIDGSSARNIYRK